MVTGLAGNFTSILPSPSGASVPVSGGIATVQDVDVDIALRMMGWTLLANQPWPAARVVRMNIPTTGAWGATITFPDGSTAPVIGGISKMPQAWVTWALGYGFAAV